MKATRLHQGHYKYREWEIEKMETGQWNMKPIDAEFWTDAANTLGDAKKMINEFWYQELCKKPLTTMSELIWPHQFDKDKGQHHTPKEIE